MISASSGWARGDDPFEILGDTGSPLQQVLRRPRVAAAALLVALTSTGSALGSPRQLDRNLPVVTSRTAYDTVGARRDAARSMARRAMELMRERRWSEAQKLLSASYELVDAPTIAVLEGDTLVEMGRLNEAMTRFEAARRTRLSRTSPPAFRRAVALANERIRVVQERRPRLTVVLDPTRASVASLQLWVNGEPWSPDLIGIERHVDPGPYTVTAELRGKTVSKSVTLKEGAREQVVFRSSDLPMPGVTDDHEDAGSGGGTRRTLAWVSLGIGGAGLVSGAVAGLVAGNRADALEAECNPGCSPELADEVDAFEAARTASFIGYGVAALGLSTGAVLLFTSSGTSDRAASRVRPYATMSTLGVMGRF